MSSYSAQALSREDLRKLAFYIREYFGYLDVWRIPVELLLDQMLIEFNGFNYEIIPDSEWGDPTSHAETDVLSGRITIRESVYIGACDGIGRDRMTIAHEIAHYFLIFVLHIKLCSRKGTKAYNDPEWQAKCLAGELLIPYHKYIEEKTPPTVTKLEELCGVSSEAAKIQYKAFTGGDVNEKSTFSKKNTL